MYKYTYIRQRQHNSNIEHLRTRSDDGRPTRRLEIGKKSADPTTSLEKIT